MLVVYFTNYSSFDNHFWVLVMIPRAQAYRGIPVRWIGGILSITAEGGGYDMESPIVDRVWRMACKHTELLRASP